MNESFYITEKIDNKNGIWEALVDNKPFTPLNTLD